MTARAGSGVHHWSAHLALAILATEHEARLHSVTRNNARLRIARRIDNEAIRQIYHRRQLSPTAALVLAMSTILEKS